MLPAASSSPDTENRRQHDRKRLHVRVAFKPTEGQMLVGRSIDVGPGGIAVALEANLRRGTTGVLQLSILDRDRPVAFEFGSSVAYAVLAPPHGFRTGLIFDDEGRATAARLLMLLGQGGQLPDRDSPLEEKR